MKTSRLHFLFTVTFFTLAGLASAETIKGVHLSSPLVLSGSYGLTFGGETGPRNIAELEAGVGGGKILIGRDTMGPGFGYGLKAALMRTWLFPVEVDTNQLYLGVELQAGNDVFLGRLGGYRLIEGDDDDWLATLGLGFRF